MVWYCEEQVHPGVLFNDYAILGDDVIITDEKVAHVYSDVFSNLGVTISTQKSLISKTGAGEFSSQSVSGPLV